jgi:chemotaxis protein CheC
MSTATLERLLRDAIDQADAKLAALSARRLSAGLLGVRRLPLQEIAGLCGDEERQLWSVGMTLMEQPALRFLLLLSPAARDGIVSAIIDRRATTDDELVTSLLQELGNILGSTVANVLAELMAHPVHTTTPEVVCDLAGAIISTALASLHDVDDEVLLLDVPLALMGQSLDCVVFLLFDTDLSDSLDGDRHTRRSIP